MNDHSKKTPTNAENLSINEITANMQHDLAEAAESFTKGFASKVSDKENPLTIRQLENMMSKFMSDTRKISLDCVSDLLTAYDESDIIESKKANSKEKG